MVRSTVTKARMLLLSSCMKAKQVGVDDHNGRAQFSKLIRGGVAVTKDSSSSHENKDGRILGNNNKIMNYNYKRDDEYEHDDEEEEEELVVGSSSWSKTRSYWSPHPYSGIYVPKGHEWVVDDVPKNAASFGDQTYWLRNVDGVDKPDPDLPYSPHQYYYSTL
ncbi:hypothetical protein CsatA_027518 [Cannabis sativa]